MNTPLVSGITFIKHGLTLGYPIRESIESIEPLCDEVIINVGYEDPSLMQDDGTYNYLTNYFTHPKFKFFKSWWDPALTHNGEILAQQTNLAMARATGKYLQYIQGDEVVHEDDLSIIHDQIMEMERNPRIEGLIFKYLHFYGNVDVVQKTRHVYRREVRLVRNRDVKSWKDAQGFRKMDNTKLVCKNIDARIFHYGWARKEQVMNRKIKSFEKLYHGNRHEANDFNYERIWGLKRFDESHPSVMDEWIQHNKNDLDIMALKLNFRFNNIRDAVSDFIEGVTDYRIGEYKNFKEL